MSENAALHLLVPEIKVLLPVIIPEKLHQRAHHVRAIVNSPHNVRLTASLSRTPIAAISEFAVLKGKLSGNE
jgi:hypothetical protein